MPQEIVIMPLDSPVLVSNAMTLEHTWESLIALSITATISKTHANLLSRKAMDIYDELMKRNDYDRNIHAFKACCHYALCNYKEAKDEALKATDTPLRNRLLFQLAHKLGEESDIMNYHKSLSNEVEDQLCLAALHYLRSHFEEATDIYKKMLIENKDYHAINIYVALCYYKMDYYDVSLEILAVYLGLYPDSIIGVNLKACNHY